MLAPDSRLRAVEAGRSMEASLVAATWGLVAVTALLVGASLVPQVVAQRAAARQLAAQIVPDMNILNSRLRALADRLLDADQWEKEDVEREIDNAEGMLSMVEPITEVRSAGLEFASETFFAGT